MTAGSMLWVFIVILLICLVKSFHLRMSHRVLVVGLNPALQRQVTIAGLIKGSVNRASEVSVGIGGKGQNVLVASNFMHMREDTMVDVAQFVGSGGEGDSLIELLKAFYTRENLTIRSKTPLRNLSPERSTVTRSNTTGKATLRYLSTQWVTLKENNLLGGSSLNGTPLL